jgi:hypothetical protein
MNIADTKKQISMALEQAHISERKMNYYTVEKDMRAAFVYKVRSRALFAYARHLENELKKHDRKIYKRANY